MSRFSPTQIFESIRRWIGGRIAARVVWFTSMRCDLNGQACETMALVAVVGREYYEEAQRSYPIRGWFDLRRVLEVEAGGDPSCLSVIGPLQGDERVVTTYRLAEDCPKDSLNAIFWVPETLLLGAATTKHGVITVERDGVRYFAAANGTSHLAGGAIRSPRLFALASGVPVDIVDTTLGAEEVRREIPEGLATLDLSTLWGLRSPLATERLKNFARPAASFVAAALLVYLGLVSAYLAAMDLVRNRQLEALGSEVTVLLAQQRAIDVMTKERQGLSEVVASRAPAWPVWEITAAVWRNRGAVYSLNIVDDTVTVRCTGPVATEILEALRKLNGYTDARFDSAVRQGGLGQDFVVTLRRAKESSKK
jgi:hypothetical protein